MKKILLAFILIGLFCSVGISKQIDRISFEIKPSFGYIYLIQIWDLGGKPSVVTWVTTRGKDSQVVEKKFKHIEEHQLEAWLNSLEALDLQNAFWGYPQSTILDGAVWKVKIESNSSVMSFSFSNPQGENQPSEIKEFLELFDEVIGISEIDFRKKHNQTGDDNSE